MTTSVPTPDNLCRPYQGPRAKAMLMVAVMALGLGSYGLAHTAPAAAAALPMMDESRGVMTIAPLLEKVTPGVVNISVKAHVPVKSNPLLKDPFFRRFFGVPNQQPQMREAMAAGSGVIVDAKKGYVLTNNHVIDHADSIVVTLKDRRQLKAKLIGTDKETDIALLKIDPGNLTQLTLGNSDDLKVGDVVIAIGNPFAIGQTVTSGIVSALGRTGLGIEGYEDFIQTDASINPGNSGGALINSKGELVGINTAIIGPGGGNVGIGFAVPVNMVKAVMTQLEKFGEVRRGQLGVTIQNLTPEIAKAMGVTATRGAIVTNVVEKSPAAKAGLKAGDVITAVNGRDIRNASDLRNRIGLIPTGETVKLDFTRDGKAMSVSAVLAKIMTAEVEGEATVPELAGAAFEDLPPDHPLANKVHGVLVSGLKPGSPAWRFGLREGDVIVGVNREDTPDVKTFVKQVKKADRVIAMNVIRNGSALFIVIQR